MAFILRTDFAPRCDTAELNVLAGTDDTLIATVDSDVQEEITALVTDTYDMATEFAKTDTARSALLVRYATDLIIYELFARVAPHQLSALRQQRADDARAMLAKAGNPSNNFSPDWATPELPDGVTTPGGVRWGGSEATNKYFY